MITANQLIALFVAHKVDEEATLRHFLRLLRRAGRITEGKAGRAGSVLTPLDVSRFTIACFATDHPSAAVDAEQFFSGLTVFNTMAVKPAAVSTEPGERLDLAFADALLALPPGAELIIDRSGPRARFRSAGTEVQFEHSTEVPMPQRGEGADLAAHLAAFNAWGGAELAAGARFRTGKNLHAVAGTSLLVALSRLIAGKAGDR